MAIKDNFFEELRNGSRWDIGVSINRLNSLPLDANSVFDSLEAATNYALGNPAEGTLNNAYAGQTLTVIENGTTKYYIIQTDGTLLELASIDLINEEIQKLTQVRHAYYAQYYTNRDGTLTGEGTRPTIKDALDSKVNTYQGIENKGKAMIIDGSGRVVPGNPTIEGTVDAAGKWSSSLTLSLFGDVTGSVTFDGSEGSVVLDTTVPGDIIRGTYMPFEISGAFILEGTNTTIAEGRADKLYLDTTNNKFYLWSSDHFVEFEVSGGNNSGEGESVNLDNYYTIDKTCSAINNALSNYYTKGESIERITAALSNYVKTTELEDYATKVWVNQELAKVSTGGTVDLSNYFTKTETNSAIAAALTSIEELQSNNEYLKVADNDGRVIMEVDKDGLYTSNIYLPNISLADRAIEWDDKSKVTWTQKTTSGTKIATININGTNTDIYAPSGGTGGSSTDEKVKQVSDTSTAGNYPLLFKNSTGTSTTTDSVKFNSNIYVQPSHGKLYGRLIYSECYYASNGTKLDDIYASKSENTTAGSTVTIKAEGNTPSANANYKIPFSGSSAATAYNGELYANAKLAFNPYTNALTIGNYTNPWEKTFITSDGLTVDKYYFAGVSEPTSTVSNTYRIKTIYANGEGGLYAKKYYTNGSDFAEYFEWLDGNPNNEDRCGLLVALEGECIRPANADDECIGAITGSASYIGNAYDSEWQGKYLTDVYGRPLTKEVQIPAQVDAITGEVVQAAYTTQEYIINPEYNPMTPYVSRTERREWAIVGLTGQVVVRDDGTCVVGSHLAPLSNGIGTISDKGYKVMKRIDANHVKILIK